MDKNKRFLSFNKKHDDYFMIKETMSKDLKIKADYTTIPILDIENPNVTDKGNIRNALHNILKDL